MKAFKGFREDLTCTMGKGVFRYEVGKWYKEDSAHCQKDGFHATDNPLDVLQYYSRRTDRYFIVELRGNIDEDDVNSRISAPEIKLEREITREKLIALGIEYMIKNPKKKWSNVVNKDEAEGSGDDHVIVRGAKPKAKGLMGDTLWIVKQRKNEITEVGVFVIDGESYLEDTWYNVNGGVVNEKKRA